MTLLSIELSGTGGVAGPGPGPAGGSLSLRPGSGPRPRRCCRPTRSATAL